MNSIIDAVCALGLSVERMLVIKFLLDLREPVGASKTVMLLTLIPISVPPSLRVR